MLILNAYMPCDKGYDDGYNLQDFRSVLMEVRLLLEKYNPDYVVFGGDLNTDIERNTPQTNELVQFAQECDLRFCISLCSDDVPYTFINSSNVCSTIDHFMLSANLESQLLQYSIIDNTLFSDHVPLSLSLDINVPHSRTKDKVYKKRIAWCKANEGNIVNYKKVLSCKLSKLNMKNDVFTCKDTQCTYHSNEIRKIYSDIVKACLEAGDECIPKTKKNNKNIVPGWNNHVKHVKDEALYWHREWKLAGRPHNGQLAEMRRTSRLKYHRVIKNVKKQNLEIRMENMASAIAGKNHRQLWSEVRKIKGRDNFTSTCIDNVSEDKQICNIFSNKYKALYNSVPYDGCDMDKIKQKVDNQIKYSDVDTKLYITIDDVINSVKKLKCSKADGSEGLYSDHLINGSHSLFVLLSLIFNSMLVHGVAPDSMLLGTMVPIPKNKRQSLSNSDNYRSIALSSIIGKILDIIILMKEEHTLLSSALQFGFKQESSTTQCSMILNETISYYNYNHTNVYVLMLDATKAFDRVQYCKLFQQLLDRKVSPIILRLLINMYTSQKLQVRWGTEVSDSFNVSNGVKQGGILSPILFAVYIDGLLSTLEKQGIGCHIGSKFVGALAYADDITLISPTVDGMRRMIKTCEDYAKEYNIMFNGKKSQLLMFKGRNCKSMFCDIYVNGAIVKYIEKAVHLGHTISTIDRESNVKKAISEFWKSFNIFHSDFGHVRADIKNKLFQQYCCSFYGSPLWKLDSNSVNDICIAWRKSLRMLWNVPYMTHCYIVEGLAGSAPLQDQLGHRFVKFFKKCQKSTNDIVSFVIKACQLNPMSVTWCNYKSLVFKHNINIMNDPKCLYQQSNIIRKNNKDTLSVLYELIMVRDNHLLCDIFDLSEVQDFIHNICVA